MHSFAARGEKEKASSSSSEWAGWATSPKKIPLVLVSVEGFTVTWAVMLPQRAFTACQEKFLEPGVEGALLREKKKKKLWTP